MELEAEATSRRIQARTDRVRLLRKEARKQVTTELTSHRVALIKTQHDNFSLRQAIDPSVKWQRVDFFIVSGYEERSRCNLNPVPISEIYSHEVESETMEKSDYKSSEATAFVKAEDFGVVSFIL